MNRLLGEEPVGMFDYKCNKCGFTDEYCTSLSVPKKMNPPEICPKCGEGKMEKQLSLQGQSFDLIGYCYENMYGKHAWKRNLTQTEQAEVISGKRDPY